MNHLLFFPVLFFLLAPSLRVEAQKNIVATTPPMGWNSYDCYGSTVKEHEVKDNATMMAVHLKPYGWQYVVIDYCWFYPYPGAMGNPPQSRDFTPNFRFDEKARLLPAIDRFPTSAGNAGLKPLADYVHSLGLKFGIHVMRGVPREAVAKKLPIGYKDITADMIADVNDTCTWLNAMYGLDITKPGAQEYYNSVYQLYASWGVDFVKVDDIWRHMDEIEVVRKAIDHCGREMVLSISAGGKEQIENAEFLKTRADMWRISNDFWDRWEDLKEQFDLCHMWEEHIGNGHWPDADMIPIGLLARRGPEQMEEHRSHFTRDEQRTLFSLWSICRSPLMFGGDLTMITKPELLMLTHSEMLAVNQNSENNRQLFRQDNEVAWVADVPGTENKYLALFNLGEEASEIEVKFTDLGIGADCRIRDLWSGRDLGSFSLDFKAMIPPHGSGLYKLTIVE